MFDETTQIRAGRSATTDPRGPHRRLADLAALAPLDDAPEEWRDRAQACPPPGDETTRRRVIPARARDAASSRAGPSARTGDDTTQPIDTAQPVDTAQPIDTAPDEGVRSDEAAGHPPSGTEPDDPGTEPDDTVVRNEGRLPAALRARGGRLVERWVPAGARRGPSRRVIASVAAGVVTALGLVGFVFADEPAAEAPPPLPAAHTESPSGSSQPSPQSSTNPATSGPGAASPGAAGDSPDRLVVSVVGKVRTPGLVRVRAGARVADAVESAGGAPRRADLLSVNLARELVDGEQIYVGVPVPPGVSTGADRGGTAESAGADGEAADEPVPLNSADQEQLESLPGVGEVTARRILEWRDEHGGFTAVEQLREVDGIGTKRFDSLRDAVSVA